MARPGEIGESRCVNYKKLYFAGDTGKLRFVLEGKDSFCVWIEDPEALGSSNSDLPLKWVLPTCLRGHLHVFREFSNPL